MPSNTRPDNSARLLASNPSDATLELLTSRRSLTVKDIKGPGPDADQLTKILTIGARVPDHKKQVPWRFLTFQGNARNKIGSILKEIYKKNNPEAEKELTQFEENRFMRAPLIIAVVSTASPENPKVPEWEQILSAGAVCQNILIASNAMGFAGQWLTEWYAYDRDFLSALQLDEKERIAGFIYIGSATKSPKERGRPLIDEITQKWD